MTQKTHEKRVIDGLLVVNKPRDLTSNAVLQQVKRLFFAKKAGHTGSLDPMATGMLPICFGEATKFGQYLLDADKCYEVTGLLGIKTNTADAMGDVIARVENVRVTEAQLMTVLDEFSGMIQQVPSMFSALKHQGKPLYHFARAGIEIERPARPVQIHHLQLNAFDGHFFQLTVICSKGTYIRNLVEDIGERLQTGAHVTQLHRLYTAGLEHSPMVTLEELACKSLEERNDLLLPVDRAIDYLPQCVLDDHQAYDIRLGRTIQINTLSPDQELWRIYDANHFIGLGEQIEAGALKGKRLVSSSF